MADSNPPHSTRPDKGKAKSTDNEEAQPSAADGPPQADGPTSVFSRIAQSAASLSRDLVAPRPGGNDLASLASATAGKGEPVRARAPSSAVGQTAFASSSRAAAPSLGGLANAAIPGSSHAAAQHAAAQEQAFAQFLDGADIDMSLPVESIIGLNDNMTLADELGFSAARMPPAASLDTTTTTQVHISLAVAEQESRDGLDVVNLLAAGPGEEEPDYDDIELAEDEAEALKRALFGDGQLAPRQDWDNVLNFIPDFVRPHPQGYEYEGEGGGEDGGPSGAQQAAARRGSQVKSHETRQAMGMPHAATAMRLWLDQWHDVLTRYDDAVWGGLAPLVAHAREEVDELQQSDPEPLPAQPPPGTKALDRLRQILGHLQAR